MFFSALLIGVLSVFFYLWGDYMKVLIYLEILTLIFIVIFFMNLKLDFFSMNFFFSCLIFLVCESSLGFLLFIFYISMESEVVKKLSIVQF